MLALMNSTGKIKPLPDILLRKLRRQMTHADYKKATGKALEVLKAGCITQPPVPVHLLVADYGLSIQFFSPPPPHNSSLPPIAGAIVPDQQIILVNINDSPRRQIFTIAHELGHWLLHKEILLSNPETGILFRRPLGNEKDPIEQEANCFAANLLVPEFMLTKYLGYTRDETKLAEIFNVSQQVIGYRMTNLRRVWL